MKCSHCKKTKKPEHLIPNSKRVCKDGTITIYYFCRACNRKRAKAYRKTPRGKQRIRQAVYKSTAKHREKQRARQTLNYHLNKGHITKKPCSCGAKKVEAHHPDYAQPLIVEWVCRTHHADIHRRLKNTHKTT